MRQLRSTYSTKQCYAIAWHAFLTAQIQMPVQVFGIQHVMQGHGALVGRDGHCGTKKPLRRWWRVERWEMIAIILNSMSRLPTWHLYTRRLIKVVMTRKK